MSGNKFPRLSFSSFIVLNLTILNILPFFPGRSWKKKTFPLLAKYKTAIITPMTGDKMIKTPAAIEKSISRLKKCRYIVLIRVAICNKVINKETDPLNWVNSMFQSKLFHIKMLTVRRFFSPVDFYNPPDKNFYFRQSQKSRCISLLLILFIISRAGFPSAGFRR